MKKTVFAACLVFCLLSTGCGSNTNNEAETSSASTTKATTEAVSEPHAKLTAVPHPKSVSTNVPTISAKYFFISLC